MKPTDKNAKDKIADPNERSIRKYAMTLDELKNYHKDFKERPTTLEEEKHIWGSARGGAKERAEKLHREAYRESKDPIYKNQHKNHD